MSVKVDHEKEVVIIDEEEYSFTDEYDIPVFECEDSIIVIENEEYYVNKVSDYGYLPMIEIGRYLEFYVAEDSAHAGKANREYWEDMIENDQKEFAFIVGEDTLIAWALGKYASPGSISVRSLTEWLELTEEHPEEQWASYDNSEQEVNAISSSLLDEIGFCPTVAYRHN